MPLAHRLGGEERVEDLVADRGVERLTPIEDVGDHVGTGVAAADGHGPPPGAHASRALMSRLRTTWLIRAG